MEINMRIIRIIMDKSDFLAYPPLKFEKGIRNQKQRLNLF